MRHRLSLATELNLGYNTRSPPLCQAFFAVFFGLFSCQRQFMTEGQFMCKAQFMSKAIHDVAYLFNTAVSLNCVPKSL